MAKTLLRWYEPYFFVLRLRTWKGWLGRIAIMAGLAAAIFLFLHFVAGPKPWMVELQISLLAGVLFPLLFDLPYLQREITITDSGVDWIADGVKIVFRGSFPHAGTSRIESSAPVSGPSPSAV